MNPVPLALLVLSALALALAAYAYVGYPLVVRCCVRRRTRPDIAAAARPAWPRVTVLVAAHNEAGVIEARLRNLLGQEYPEGALEVLVVSDASDDGTDAIVQRLGDPRVRLLRAPERGGKTAAINRAAPLATGEVLVHTDANVMFEPGALRCLAAAFADPVVGVALGEVSFTNAESPDVAGGEGLYWRFETWIKHVEAERGLLAVANGGIYALRRSLWRALPATIAGDAAEPLLAAIGGFATVVAPGARARERAAGSLREEFERKVRIIAQQVACWRWIGLSALPRRIAWAYASHKLLRYAVPILFAVAFAGGATAAALGARAGLVIAAVTALPAVAAPLGLLRLPGRLGSLARIPLYFVVVNAAAVRGVLRGLSGGAPATWDVPASTRPVTGGAPGGSGVR